MPDDEAGLVHQDSQEPQPHHATTGPTPNVAEGATPRLARVPSVERAQDGQRHHEPQQVDRVRRRDLQWYFNDREVDAPHQDHSQQADLGGVAEAEHGRAWGEPAERTPPPRRAGTARPCSARDLHHADARDPQAVLLHPRGRGADRAQAPRAPLLGGRVPPAPAQEEPGRQPGLHRRRHRGRAPASRPCSATTSTPSRALGRCSTGARGAPRSRTGALRHAPSASGPAAGAPAAGAALPRAELESAACVFGGRVAGPLSGPLVSATASGGARVVAQPGSAPSWGLGGRGFKSRLPDTRPPGPLMREGRAAVV